MADDIPGTSFSDEEIGKLTIAQLKFWLNFKILRRIYHRIWHLKGIAVIKEG